MSQPSNHAPTIAFPALNGMRGVAALAVAVFHARPLFARQLAPGGYLAVDLFFVLSGCVIAHAYAARLAAGMPFVDFIKLRLVRFAPFHFAGLGLGIALAFALLWTNSPSALPPPYVALAAVCGLLFLPLPLAPNGAVADIFPLNVPAWSLFYEIVVNALYALCVRRLTSRVLVVVVLAAAAVLVPAVWMHGNASFGPALHHAPFAFGRTVFSFGVGVLVYRFRRPVGLDPMITIAFTTVLLVVPVADTWRPLFDLACIAVAFPAATAALLGAVIRSPSHGRAFTFLGDASYGLYAIHYPLIWLLRGAAEKLQFDATIAGILLLIALVIGCAALERRVDRPLRAWLTMKLVPPRSAA